MHLNARLTYQRRQSNRRKNPFELPAYVGTEAVPRRERDCGAILITTVLTCLCSSVDTLFHSMADLTAIVWTICDPTLLHLRSLVSVL